MMFISQKDIPGDVNSSWEGGGVGVCCKSNFRLLDFFTEFKWSDSLSGVKNKQIFPLNW